MEELSLLLCKEEICRKLYAMTGVNCGWRYSFELADWVREIISFRGSSSNNRVFLRQPISRNFYIVRR